jgi:hypothetical protein
VWCWKRNISLDFISVFLLCCLYCVMHDPITFPVDGWNKFMRDLTNSLLYCSKQIWRDRSMHLNLYSWHETKQQPRNVFYRYWWASTLPGFLASTHTYHCCGNEEKRHQIHSFLGPIIMLLIDLWIGGRLINVSFNVVCWNFLCNLKAVLLFHIASTNKPLYIIIILYKSLPQRMID